MRLMTQIDAGEAETTVERTRAPVDGIAVAQPRRTGIARKCMQATHRLRALPLGEMRIDRITAIRRTALGIGRDNALTLPLLCDEAALCHVTSPP